MKSNCCNADMRLDLASVYYCSKCGRRSGIMPCDPIPEDHLTDATKLIEEPTANRDKALLLYAVKQHCERMEQHLADKIDVYKEEPKEHPGRWIMSIESHPSHLTEIGSQEIECDKIEATQNYIHGVEVERDVLQDDVDKLHIYLRELEAERDKLSRAVFDHEDKLLELEHFKHEYKALKSAPSVKGWVLSHLWEDKSWQYQVINLNLDNAQKSRTVIEQQGTPCKLLRAEIRLIEEEE